VRKIFYAGKVVFIVTRFWFRFFSGRPLSGDRKTDATFTRPATRSLDPSHTALRWEMMRGASRLAWRIGGLYLLLLAAVLLLLRLSSAFVSLPAALRPSFLLLAHGALLAAVGVSYLLRRHMREQGFSYPIVRRVETEDGGKEIKLDTIHVEGRRAWLEEKVLPVSRAASMILTTSIPDRKALEWVTIPKDYREPGGKPVEIRLPSSFTGADEGVKKRLQSSVSQKLGMKSISSRWETEGSSPRVLFSSPPEPPSLVSFADVRQYLEASEEYRPLLGVVGNGEALLAEMVEDSPHVAISAGPGAGKSTLAKLIMMQALRWGWGIVVIDWKMTKAYEWIKGMPGVTYLSDIEDIHDMGVRIAQEVDIRKTAGMAGRANVLVVRDEWNATSDLLTAWWADYRARLEPEERRITPVKSPAQRGYAVLDFAGREFGMFDLCIAQRFSARVFNGNADIRECFQIKCLARYSDQTRKMLAPDIKPFPKKSNVPGRWTIVAGEDVAVIQVPMITSEEARKYAEGGVSNPITPFTSSYDTSLTQQTSAPRTLGDPLRLDAATRSQELPVLDAEELTAVDARKLSEMVDVLIPLGITWNVLRNAARDGDKGDPTFPKAYGGSPNRGYTYDFEAVKEWARRRHASQQAEKVSRG
jgi:hypothetical protein